MKRTLIALSLAASVGATTPVLANDMTFGELHTIRILAGQAVGGALPAALEAGSIGVIANQTSLCTSLAGGLGSGMVSADPEVGFIYEALATPDDAGTVVGRVAETDVVYLAFGGNTDRASNVAMLHQVLRTMAEADWDGALVFHMSTWAQKQVHEIVSEDEIVADYLAGKDNLFAATLDLGAGQAVLQSVSFDGSEFALTEAGRVELRDDLVDLFRRMLG